MPVESLILRRCHPVPVTFSDLREAYDIAMQMGRDNIDKEYRATRAAMARGEAPPEPSMLEDFWPAAIKEATGAIDEVYAVIDGREVRVAVITDADRNGTAGWSGYDLRSLLEKADEAGYWQRPHEVRHVLEEPQMSHATMQRIAANSIAAGSK